MRCPGPAGPPPGRRSKIGLPRCNPGPPLAAAGGAVGGRMDALYTGRGPVCGITMRRGGGAAGVRAWGRCTGVDSAAIVGTATLGSGAGLGVSTTGGAATGGSATTAAAGGSGATGATAAGAFATTFFSAGRGCSSRIVAGATGGLTITPTGGATTTTGRGTVATTGALATTGPEGGRDAMAGADGGGAMIGGAWRGCGTILRGSGRGGGAAGRTGAAGGV
jgi:hypothetical protein